MSASVLRRFPACSRLAFGNGCYPRRGGGDATDVRGWPRRVGGGDHRRGSDGERDLRRGGAGNRGDGARGAPGAPAPTEVGAMAGGSSVAHRANAPRRRLAKTAALLFVVASVIAALPAANRTVAAQDLAAPADPVAADAFAGIELPGGWGESELQVFVEATGHTVLGTMLDYWRATGGADVYGNPISEPFPSADGRYSQAFEHAVFQYVPENLRTNDPTMTLMPIGDDALRSRLGIFRRDGRRHGGGGDRRGDVWRRLDPESKTARQIAADGGTYVEASRHTIAGGFLKWYERHEGRFYLGNPLSQPLAERGMKVQYFEGGLLMGDRNGKVRLAPVVRSLAIKLGIDTKRVEGDGLPVYDEEMFATAPNPNPRGDQDAAGIKRVEVSISQQRLRAYQGDELVMETPVSTGLEPNFTEEGRFHVWLKFYTEDMVGTTGADGSVIGV